MPLESMAGWKKLTVIKGLLKRPVDTDLLPCRALVALGEEGDCDLPPGRRTAQALRFPVPISFASCHWQIYKSLQETVFQAGKDLCITFPYFTSGR